MKQKSFLQKPNKILQYLTYIGLTKTVIRIDSFVQKLNIKNVERRLLNKGVFLSNMGDSFSEANGIFTLSQQWL